MTAEEQLIDIGVEVSKMATSMHEKHGMFASAHEGYAVLAEEVDELWDEVKVKQAKRDLVNMRKEALQVAACAIKFVLMLDGRK